MSTRDFQALQQDLIIEDEPGGNWFDTGVNSAIGFIDKVSKIPQALSDSADALNQEMIDTAQTVKGGVQRTVKEGGQRAESNLIGGRIDSIFKRASRWLQTGNNAFIAIALIIGIIWIARR